MDERGQAISKEKESKLAIIDGDSAFRTGSGLELGLPPAGERDPPGST
jgi:hypothetical protein